MPPAPPRRADALRNRAALVAAARQVLAARGLDASLDEIASVARTGNATLYRHFPTRADLLRAVFADQLERYRVVVEAALADADPWAAVCDYLTGVCALQAENMALADLMSGEVTAEQPPVDADLARLLARAQEAGALRADVTVTDVLLVLVGNAGVVRRTAALAPAASARFVALLLDGLRAGAATPAPSAPSPDALAAVLAATSPLPSPPDPTAGGITP